MYSWDFDNDGNIDWWGYSQSWTFWNKGNKKVTLTVTDGNGGIDTTIVLALDCGEDIVSIYRGTPTSPQGTIWTLPVGSFVAFVDASTHDFWAL
jgi:hypothetical protein